MGNRMGPKKIPTVGLPEVSLAGEEVFAYHLFRYLAPWLREAGLEKIVIALGFPRSSARLGVYHVGLHGAKRLQQVWDYQDLEDAWRFNQGRIHWESGDGSSVTFLVEPLVENHHKECDPGRESLVGFVLFREDLLNQSLNLEKLQTFACEAINIARRNGVRLFFDENRDLALKDLLYHLMDRLPEWTGCDHSAALLLTHDLDAITMEVGATIRLNVLAERIFFEEKDEKVPRLVGMTALPKAGGLLGELLERQTNKPDREFFAFQRDDDGTWQGSTEGGLGHQDWYQISGRPKEEMVYFLPLVHREYGERDLLGFLSLSFRIHCDPGPCARSLFREIGSELARHLRRSVLYTMSVRKMWVVRKIHEAAEEAILGGFPRGLEGFIEEISELVSSYVEVPSFALGFLTGEPGARRLRYVNPKGWSRYDSLELPVDVAPHERSDSGVSMLAIRLKRPVVLAGGHGTGEELEFRNYLWVNEERGEIVDARSEGVSMDYLEKNCERLQKYYRPARETAYATLAYPVVYGTTPLGVLTVEVEKSTDWIWWTGFGGHLFWDMIVRELSTAFYFWGRK